MRFLGLGNSYTVGTGVEHDDRWVNRLLDRLRADGVDVGSARVVAGDGWSTERLAAAIERRSFGQSYDLVTLLVGANDAFRGRAVESFREGFSALVEQSVEFGRDPSNVIVLTIPDYTVTPFVQHRTPDYDDEVLDAYNRVVRAEANAAGTRLVDVVPISRQVTENPTLVAGDGLHPSPEQHERWVERIYPVARSVLEE